MSKNVKLALAGLAWIFFLSVVSTLLTMNSELWVRVLVGAAVGGLSAFGSFSKASQGLYFIVKFVDEAEALFFGRAYLEAARLRRG